MLLVQGQWLLVQNLVNNGPTPLPYQLKNQAFVCDRVGAHDMHLNRTSRVNLSR